MLRHVCMQAFEKMPAGVWTKRSSPLIMRWKACSYQPGSPLGIHILQLQAQLAAQACQVLPHGSNLPIEVHVHVCWAFL